MAFLSPEKLLLGKQSRQIMWGSLLVAPIVKGVGGNWRQKRRSCSPQRDNRDWERNWDLEPKEAHHVEVSASKVLIYLHSMMELLMLHNYIYCRKRKVSGRACLNLGVWKPYSFEAHENTPNHAKNAYYHSFSSL